MADDGTPEDLKQSRHSFIRESDAVTVFIVSVLMLCCAVLTYRAGDPGLVDPDPRVAEAIVFSSWSFQLTHDSNETHTILNTYLNIFVLIVL